MPGSDSPASGHGDFSEGTSPFNVARQSTKGPAEIRIRRCSVPEAVEEDSLAFHAKRCSILLVAGVINGVRHLVIKAEDVYATLKRRCIESSRIRRIGLACGRAHRAIKKQLQAPPATPSYSATLDEVTSLTYCRDMDSDSHSDRHKRHGQGSQKDPKLQIRWLPEMVPERKSSRSEICSFHDFFKSLQDAENRSVLDNYEIIEYVKAKRRKEPNEVRKVEVDPPKDQEWKRSLRSRVDK